MKQLLTLAVLVLGVGCASVFAQRDPCHEGEVEVAVLIDSTGHVKSVTVLKESPCPKFNEAAIQTARKDLWVPATRHGQPVSSAMRFRLHFKPVDGTFQPGTEVICREENRPNCAVELRP